MPIKKEDWKNSESKQRIVDGREAAIDLGINPEMAHSLHHIVPRQIVEWMYTTADEDALRGDPNATWVKNLLGGDQKEAGNFQPNLILGPSSASRTLPDPRQGFDPTYYNDTIYSPRTGAMREAYHTVITGNYAATAHYLEQAMAIGVGTAIEQVHRAQRIFGALDAYGIPNRRRQSSDQKYVAQAAGQMQHMAGGNITNLQAAYAAVQRQNPGIHTAVLNAAYTMAGYNMIHPGHYQGQGY